VCLTYQCFNWEQWWVIDSDSTARLQKEHWLTTSGRPFIVWYLARWGHSTLNQHLPWLISITFMNWMTNGCDVCTICIFLCCFCSFFSPD
jgi:hypothetical protein